MMIQRGTGLVQLTNNLLIRVDSWFQKEETSNISKVKTLLVNGHFLRNNFEISTITLFSQWSRTQHIRIYIRADCYVNHAQFDATSKRIIIITIISMHFKN